MSAGRILLLVFGSLLALIAIGLLAGGAALLWADTKRDDDGFFTSSTERFETSAFALVSEDLDVVSDVPGWLVDSDRFGDIRLAGSSSSAGREVFWGIGEEDAVNAYLDGVERDVVTDVDFDPFKVTYRRQPGNTRPRPPGDETFWAASIEGAGAQTLEWEVEKGRWVVVAMNADATAGVGADLSIGANIGFVREVGIGLLITGAGILLAGLALIYLGARPRPEGGAGSAGPETPEESVGSELA
jgi:hypothetical protein